MSAGSNSQIGGRRVGARAGFVAAVALALAAPAARAEVKVPAIFGPHMVLQCDRKDPVWGWARPGEEVTVSIAGKSAKTRAGKDGAWRVLLEELPVGGPHTLTVSGENTLAFDDVLIGEVWLCSGQSNMGMSVGAAKDADLEILASNHPRIRLISVPNVGTQEPRMDFRGQWARCGPRSIGDFTAVGYYFGRQLHQTLDVPIGLIDNAWGGSACEAWVRRDLLAADKKYGPLLDHWKELEERYETARAESKKPPGNLEGLMRGNARPGNIYNGALRPIIGFGIRGVVWYQGENNTSRAYQYRDLFPLMIQNWRDEWGEGDFPFYWAQLADFHKEEDEPKDSAWAELREAQTMTMDRLPNTGQAVIIDLGEGKDIHPKNKQDVGKRLARWALARDYGVHVAHQSPTFQSMKIEGKKVIVTFDHVGSGLRTFDVAEAIGFGLAGKDREFEEADARIKGKNTVEVWSDDVDEPVAVRYAWSDNPECNLYSSDGLPATPFRSDDWPGVTAGKDN